MKIPSGAAAVTAIGTLALAAWTAVHAGVARQVAVEEQAKLYAEREADLDAALGAARAASRDPVANEAAALALARAGQEYLADARVHFETAIRMRPTSPYTWSNIAAVDYLAGDTGPGFESAIKRAVELGPSEPEVQATVALYGLAVFDQLHPSAREAVERMVAAGMRRKAGETLQIAGRRGRLDVACRHLAGAPRQTEPKWTKLCEGMEATP